MADRHLHAGRLELIPVGSSDIEALHAIWTSEPVRRFLWDGEVIPLERTRAVVEESVGLFDERGYGLWMVRDGESGEPVGFGGYWHFRDAPAPELLFGVAPGHWNAGIATEVGRRLLDHAFDDLGFEIVEASTDAGNAASLRVLEKLGMRRTRRETVDGLDTVFFALARGR